METDQVKRLCGVQARSIKRAYLDRSGHHPYSALNVLIYVSSQTQSRGTTGIANE